MNQPLFTRNGIPAVRAGKAVQNALRGSVDVPAARAAAAGGVQPSGDHAKSCSGYHQRQPERIIPQKKTGRCMGKSIFPTSGICPVKNGSTMPMAINIAESTRFFKAECFIASLRGKI